MATGTVDYAALAAKAGAISSTPAPASSQSGPGADYNTLAAQAGAIDSTPSGEGTNDVGEKIIIPKDGESFEDTMRRAAAHGKSVNQSDIDKEMATAPGKVAETVASAPAMGAAGVAALAGPGELAGATSAAIKNLLPAVTKGVQGIGEWAEAHPMTARMIWEGLKLSAQFAGLYKGAQAAGKVIKAAE